MVHILHLDRPYKHVRHLVVTGPQRLTYAALKARHDNGVRFGLLSAILAAGITFRVGRSLDGDRTRARRVTRNSHTATLCRVCRAEQL